jgi:hypothetical protein
MKSVTTLHDSDDPESKGDPLSVGFVRFARCNQTNSPGLVADRFGDSFGSKEMARREYQDRTNKGK